MITQQEYADTKAQSVIAIYEIIGRNTIDLAEAEALYNVIALIASTIVRVMLVNMANPENKIDL